MKNMPKEIYLLGVGHSTPFFAELAEACGYTVAGLYHYNNDRIGQTDHGFPILGSFNDLYSSNIEGKNFMLTMGNMEIKREVSRELLHRKGGIPSLVHPNAAISRFAKISDCGVLVCSSCEIHSDAIVGEGCVLWPQVVIGHNTQLHEYVFCGPKAYVGAYIEVYDQAFIGQCSVCISGKIDSIGESAIIGAGAVVTKSVPPNVIVKGNPAKIKVQRGGEMC